MKQFLCSLGALAAFFVLTVSSTVHAQAEPIVLELHGDPLPVEELRSRIERELGRPVVVGYVTKGDILTVTWHKGIRELAVTFDSARGTVSRVITPHTEVDEVIGDAAALAQNLTSNEADDLAKPPPPPTEPEAPVVVVAPPPPAAPVIAFVPPMERPRPNGTYLPISGSFFYPLAANFGHPTARTHFDLNVLYGRYGQVDGAMIGLVDIIAGGEGATGDLNGVQIGGVVSVATGNVRGWQIGGVTTTAGNVEGAQIGGVTAVAKNLDGLQIGGVVNRAEDVRGVQIGAVNVAGKVKGMQIGVVNFADDIEGVPIGLVSVTKSGGIHPVIWGTNVSYANAGLKFATRHTYTMMMGHFSYAYDREVAGGGFGIGGHIPANRWLYIDIEGSFSAMSALKPSQVITTDTTAPMMEYRELLLVPRLRMIAGLSIDKHLSIFASAGAALEGRLYNNADASVTLMPEFGLGVQL